MENGSKKFIKPVFFRNYPKLLCHRDDVAAEIIRRAAGGAARWGRCGGVDSVMRALAGKAQRVGFGRLFPQQLEVFLQAEVVFLHIPGVGDADIAKMPGFVGDARHVPLVRRIAADKAVFPGVLHQPSVVAGAGEIRRCAGVLQIEGKVDGKARVVLAAAGLGEVAGGVVAAVVLYGCVIELLLVI